MTRAFPVTLLACCVLAAGAASAQQLQWQAYDFEDQQGNPMAGVYYGIPETDATLLSATCTQAAPREIVVHLNVDPGPNQAGAQTTLTVAIGSSTDARDAAVIEGAEGRYTEVRLNRHDSLWETLMAGQAGTMAVLGGAWSDFHLRGSRAAISQFLANCDRIAGGAISGDVAGGEPLTGPLFMVQGSQDVPMVAGLQDPYTVVMIPPGTEVMSFNTIGPLNGRDWVQVATERGAGTSGWIERSALVPVTGGAAEYQNLNRVANLVIRAQPSGSAAVVGAIPPLATGILDQGQIIEGWVLVRYGNTTGWASHEYLVPIIPPAGLAPGGIQQSPASIYHQASYGNWELVCDPCRHPEDGTVCQIGLLDGPLTVFFYEGDDRMIDLVYGPPMDLHEPDASATTLRLIVDGEVIATLSTPDWQVWEMTGEIGIPTFGDMIAALRAGHSLTITLAGPSGNTSEAFSLVGFAEAQDDLLTDFPVESQFFTEGACPFQ